MKLLSVNIEGDRHFNRVISLIKKETPDVICLQEAPELFAEHIEPLGYQTAFAPTTLRVGNTKEGLMVASLHQYTIDTQYYYGSPDNLQIAQHRVVSTFKNALQTIKISHDGQTYFITNTHVMVTPDGKPTEHQKQGVENMLRLARTYHPHILCGDFNMPRNHNDLYNTITKHYKDEIPLSYTSSLDRTLHRAGPSEAELDEPIFDSYMVDYIFSQPPYNVANVRLQFGVSDHAAVIAEISKL